MGEIIQAGGAFAFPGENFQNRPVTRVLCTAKAHVPPTSRGAGPRGPLLLD